MPQMMNSGMEWQNWPPDPGLDRHFECNNDLLQTLNKKIKRIKRINKSIINVKKIKSRHDKKLVHLKTKIM